MYGRRLILTILLIAMFLLVSCQSSSSSSENVTPDTSSATEKSIPVKSSQVPRIKLQALKERLDAGENITVVDARSSFSYELEHIPGALSIPLAEIEARHDELSKEHKIVLYCS